MPDRRRPGEVRDAIRAFLASRNGADASVKEIRAAVEETLGGQVAASSIRSALNLNVGQLYARTGRGRYRLLRR